VTLKSNRGSVGASIESFAFAFDWHAIWVRSTAKIQIAKTVERLSKLQHICAEYLNN